MCNLQSILGYNFCQDANALDPRFTDVNNLNSVTIQNGIFDNLNLTRDVTTEYSSELPTVWDFLTVLDCNFNGNIDAGNLEYVLSQLSAVKIKRRVAGTFDWMTLFTVPINSVDDLLFERFDYFNAYGVEYEYALVPVVSGVEGNYITSTVDSVFNGVFICDSSSIYKFYAGVNFGGGEQVNKTGVFEPLGSKFPIVISNGVINYFKSTLSGTIISQTEYDTRQFSPLDNIKLRSDILSFLTKKKAKIIKDWNGRIYLILVVDNISVSPNNDIGGRFADIGFNYVQGGDANSRTDMENVGLIGVT